MALVPIQLNELQDILALTAELATAENYLGGEVLWELYNTGLRINEVLEVNRWKRLNATEFSVQLSKREGVRLIPQSAIQPGLLPHYDTQTPLVMETYSAVRNLFARLTPALYFEDFKKTTKLHAFRYSFIKQLRANGMSISDIAAAMGHLSTAATSGYVIASIWRGPYK